MDRLAALLSRFSLHAQMFHSGPLCGIVDFGADDGVGQLHLVKRGPLRVEHTRRRTLTIEVPSLVFYPRPLAHRFIADATRGADMACANVRFGGGALDPVAQALPAIVVMPLAELDGSEAVLDTLFAEAFGTRCGRQLIVDRLFEVVLIRILRALMQEGAVDRGLLAGMAHPQLARSLVALHERPADDWTLELLAARAGMSRSRYAEVFRDTLGVTPGDYLARWRLTLAQDLLRRGLSLKRVAVEVGYGSSAALSRVFKTHCGASPRAWMAAGP